MCLSDSLTKNNFEKWPKLVVSPIFSGNIANMIPEGTTHGGSWGGGGGGGGGMGTPISSRTI